MRITRALMAITIGLAGAVASLTVGGGAAHADSVDYTDLSSASSWLNMDVSGASLSAGAPIIQWVDNNGDNQGWIWPESGSSGYIVNKHSGMCVTTDGVAGHQLFQEPCAGAWGPYQIWTLHTYIVPSPVLEPWTLGWFTNNYSGLVIDVNQGSHNSGAAIIGWYGTGQLNQSWIINT